MIILPIIINIHYHLPLKMEANLAQQQIQIKKVPRVQQQVVTHRVGFRETSGGKFRRGIIYYEYNRQTKTIKYGASIFQTSAKKPEHYDSAGHHKTARERFEQHPVTVENFADNTTLPDFNQRLRNLLFRYGCKNSPSRSLSGSCGSASGSPVSSQV